jgi:hypothetical protein
VDDRKDRLIDRFGSLLNKQLVGTKYTDFLMLEGLDPLLPWIVDHKAKENFGGRLTKVSKSMRAECSTLKQF